MAGGGFNSYAAGSKVYNGGSSAPTMGPVDPSGYAERDLKYRTQKKNTAILRRLQARQGKRYMSSDNLSTPSGRIV